MKIEIGESLIYSFLRHEKNCLIVQTNWKPSGNWHIDQDIQDKAIYEFDKINKHYAFSEIFKSGFEQTIKQAEIDILGVDQDNRIYAFEVAFHENGLQYGSKIETKDRIFKKLLRSLITLKLYFPDKKYSLAFCSPKVNKATEIHIKEYFEVLKNDFQSIDIEFNYYSNDKFNSEIMQKTLTKAITESDGGELFLRSIKLFNTANKFDTQNTKSETSASDYATEHTLPSGECIKIDGVSIPTSKEPTESVQDYVKKIMRLLLNNKLLTDSEIEKLQDKEYCKRVFKLQFSLIRPISEGYKDHLGRGRYWSREIFGNDFYVCSQWWKVNNKVYLEKLKQWLLYIQDQSNEAHDN